MIIYIGFIMEQGKLLPEFVTDNMGIATSRAKKSIDDALPNNTVSVFEIEFNEKDTPLIVASWTPEGEIITLVPKP